MLRIRNDEVAIAPIFDPQKTSSGLYIPDVAKERCDQGIIKYIGSDVKEIIDGVYFGSHVMFAAYDGTLTRLDGEGILIFLPANKLVAVIHPPETRIDGIYFKSPLEKEEKEDLLNELRHIYDMEMPEGYSDGTINNFLKKILDAGFLKNQYFPMSYEMTIQLIADAITNADWKDQYRFVDRKAASPSTSNVFK